jgi:hypothetical protein
MYINSQLSTCVGTQSPKYIEMAQGHISLSKAQLKTLKNKLISPQNDYKCLIEKFETFANLNCDLTTKIEQL